ncbi:MAG TPA: asparagine synthase (glutamine-hydrolyzing) [Clostridiales bacterium]|nr:asparagine synthase (glutamine-hydrolyzing) [Clostridiales bacterium]
MCGFCGFSGILADRESLLERMMERIRHRGPDDQGKYLDEGMALGFRRLSIIGLEDICQPLKNEDGSLVLVFNGEIYNYREIREDLQSKGHEFATHTDSEILLHLYEEKGENMLTDLRGMFAFCIWDAKRRQLFMARDYFGIKPLFYSLLGNDILIASEIKSMLEHPGFKKEVNLQALESYLTFQYSILPETFFKGVFRLLPGHYAFFEPETGKLNTQKYWEPRFTALENLDAGEAASRIDSVMQDSIRAHMVSDTEVGSFLSSGIDSSYVAACFHGDKTFTVAFDYADYNEADHARKLSEYAGIRNFCKVIGKKEYWDALPVVQYCMDEPLADASCVGLYFVSQLAAEHVKVVLSGEGADELFGGYAIYNEPFGLAFIQRLPRSIRSLLGGIAKLIPLEFKGKNYLLRGSRDVEQRFIGNAFIFNEKERKSLLRQQAEGPGPFDITQEYYQRVEGKDDTTKMQYVDLHTWLAGDILLKADRMSMAHSLELRVPFLDRFVFETAAMLPLHHRVDGKRTKIALREAASRHVPAETAQRKKLGFPTPIRIWLREEPYFTQVREAFRSPAARHFFHEDRLLVLLEVHRTGRKDLSRKIWTVYMFLLWYSQYFENGRKQDV